MMRALLNIFLTPETTPKEIGHRTEKWTSILGFFFVYLCVWIKENEAKVFKHEMLHIFYVTLLIYSL